MGLSIFDKLFGGSLLNYSRKNSPNQKQQPKIKAGKGSTITQELHFNSGSQSNSDKPSSDRSHPQGQSNGAGSKRKLGRTHIINATWGTTVNFWDVTDLLNKLVKNGRLSIMASRGTLGGDPHPGVGKYLTVEYEKNGGKHVSETPEDQLFVI